jgi:hypothetical protein
VRIDLLRPQKFQEFDHAVNRFGIDHGILTVDGLHPCGQQTPDALSADSIEYQAVCPLDTHGNMLLADAMAEGLLRLLRTA